MSTDNRFVKDTMTITYYCSERRKFFKRLIRVDPDLELQRKINGLQFTLLKPQRSLYHSLVINRINGKSATSRDGDICSVAAYLFGPEYWRANRINPMDVFNFRRAAFIPRADGQIKFEKKFKQDRI